MNSVEGNVQLLGHNLRQGPSLCLVPKSTLPVKTVMLPSCMTASQNPELTWIEGNPEDQARTGRQGRRPWPEGFPGQTKKAEAYD